MTDKSKTPPIGYDVHTSHCCVRCGCKYDNDDCTVVNKVYRQEYPCGSYETCGAGTLGYEPPIIEVETIHNEQGLEIYDREENKC